MELIMKTNVGGIDKILRVVVGIALIAMAALGVVGAWGWIGVVPLLTGLFRRLPGLLAARHEHLPDQEGGLGSTAASQLRAAAGSRFLFQAIALTRRI
jgi:hypothetical protein